MDTAERQLLEEAVELSRQNHQILCRMQRAERWGQFLVLPKWLVFVAAALAVYYYLQPLLGQLLTYYEAIGQPLPDLPPVSPR